MKRTRDQARRNLSSKVPVVFLIAVVMSIPPPVVPFALRMMSPAFTAVEECSLLYLKDDPASHEASHVVFACSRVFSVVLVQ